MSNLSDRIKKEPDAQPNNPLHGVRLDTILTELHLEYGWDGLATEFNFNCFKSNPTMKSSLKFLRKTPWARARLEKHYLRGFSPK